VEFCGLVGRPKDFDLTNVGVSPVLVVGNDGHLHKECLQIRLLVPAESSGSFSNLRHMHDECCLKQKVAFRYGFSSLQMAAQVFGIRGACTTNAV
jgi:hypothetical protein